jgi:hypothetical protein
MGDPVFGGALDGPDEQIGRHSPAQGPELAQEVVTGERPWGSNTST